MSDGTTASPDRSYAVVGATGQQGGAAARALLANGERVRALVRNVNAPAAQELRKHGAELVSTDLDDAASLVAAFAGVDGVFAMTTNWTANGTEGEVRNGLAIADAAVSAGVPRLVYSSVGGAERHTGIPHFDSKRRVEEYLQGRLDVRFVRPTFFMENLADAAKPSDDAEIVFRFPIAAGVPLQMVAVADIGIVAAAILRNPDVIAGDGIEIAGDELTGEQIAAALGARADKPARFEPLPLDAVGNEDLKAMFTWFNAPPSYRADIAATVAIDPGVLSFTGWLQARA